MKTSRERWTNNSVRERLGSAGGVFRGSPHLRSKLDLRTFTDWSENKNKEGGPKKGETGRGPRPKKEQGRLLGTLPEFGGLEYGLGDPRWSTSGDDGAV